MRTRVKNSKPKSEKTMNFKEVVTVHSDAEANKLISEGWEILFVGAVHVDNNGYNAKAAFILGDSAK